MPQRGIYSSITDYNTQHLVVGNHSHVYMKVALAHLKRRVHFVHICPETIQLKKESASDLVLQRIGILLLKLDSIYNASVRCIDALVEDLHFISSSASVAAVRNLTLSSTMEQGCWMILCFGSTGGLPDFAEIIQMAILDNCVHFIVKLLGAWYEEHLRSFQLEDTGKRALLEQQTLGDVIPLVAYTVGGKRLVTLKRHVCCSV
ncbi:hypothetical protein F7725_020422 [Dissostichus mawsoni]|uniref:Uncharacterized protein n=1 Tax=Dissostichus mawsoni TaxID=36200 RepID=A0A7J5YD61_DISMA|nr:hypothetical protein F7725_020422 [Dissostichus mawsoni]